MSDFDNLSRALDAHLGRIELRSRSENGVEIALPDLRQSHDETVLSLERSDDGWVLSDLGVTAFLLGEEFDSVIDAMICGGAPFVEEGGTLLIRTSASDPQHLAELVARFASHVGAAPLVWHSLACAVPRREQTPSTISLMAREAKGSIVQTLPRADPFLALDVSVFGALERVKAPLQFRIGSNKHPQLVAGCIDFSAGPQAEAAAKRLTSFLWDTVREIPRVQKYVIVRGSHEQVNRVAHLYDTREVTTVPSDHLAALVESVSELVEEFVG